MTTCSANAQTVFCGDDCGCGIICDTKKKEDDETPLCRSWCNRPHDMVRPRGVRFTKVGPRTRRSVDQDAQLSLSTEVEVDFRGMEIEPIGGAIEKLLAHKYECAVPVVNIGDKVNLSMTATVGDVLDRLGIRYERPADGQPGQEQADKY